MLTERKCLLCKHRYNIPFVHKCKYFPDGIPEDILNEDISKNICTVDGKGFEPKYNDESSGK